MGNWSIIPNDCASVDDNGLVTFEECAIGKTYIVTYAIKNGMCESKTTINVTGESACKCTDLVVSGDKTIDSSAATYTIGTYTAGCVTDIAASTSADWITTIAANNGEIKATVIENTSTTSARTTTITVTGKAGTETCTKTFTLTQKAKATACTCDDLAVTGTTEVPYYGGEIVVATYTADSCITNIGLTANPDCITNINVDYPNNGDISGLVGKYDGSRDINVTVTGKAGTETCSKEFVLKQIKPVTTCYRGTDNGTDVRERPVLFCGTRSTTGGTIPYTERYDSILVPGGLQYYSGTAEPTETSPWYDLTSSFVNIAPWAQMRYSNDATTVCHPEYGGVHIKVTDFEYTGQSVRSVKFWFRSKNRSLTKMTSCEGVEYDLCKQWQYEIRQCAKGYYWCGTSSSNCVAVECGSSDCHMGKYRDVPCDCDSPTPTTCTYTVNSNVEGATVTWSGGTMGTTETTAIVNGTSSISIPCAGTIRATLTKEGCTFDNSNVKVYQGGTVTINGTCSGPTPTACTCSSSNFSVTGVNVSSSGGNAVLIANFTSECEPSLSFENYAGETFINYSSTSSTYDSSTKKGKIYAKVPQNTASSNRTEQVGVYISNETDFCKHFTVTQSGATPAECYVNVKDEINVDEVNVVYKVLNSNNEEVGRLESTSLSTTERRINLQGNTDGILNVVAEYDSTSMYVQTSTSTGRCSSTIICKCSRTVNILGKLVESTSGDSKCYKLGTFIADHTLFNNLEIIYAPYFWNGSAWETGNDITVYFKKEESEESENIEHCYGNCAWTHCHPCNNVPQGCFASYSKCIIKGGTVEGKKCEYTDTVTATKYILTYEEPF